MLHPTPPRNYFSACSRVLLFAKDRIIFMHILRPVIALRTRLVREARFLYICAIALFLCLLHFHSLMMLKSLERACQHYSSSHDVLTSAQCLQPIRFYPYFYGFPDSNTGSVTLNTETHMSSDTL